MCITDSHASFVTWVWGVHWITNPPPFFPQLPNLDLGPTQFGSIESHTMIFISQWTGNSQYVGELRVGAETKDVALETSLSLANIGLREIPYSQVVRSKQDGAHQSLTQSLGPHGIAIFRYYLQQQQQKLNLHFLHKYVILYQLVKVGMIFIFI